MVPSVKSTAPTHASRAEVLEIVDGLGGDLDAVASELAVAIHARLPELDDDLFVMTCQSTRANVGVIVSLLREGLSPASAIVPEEALAYAREYVRRGLGVETLMRAYRIGQAGFTRMWLERLRSLTDDASDLADAIGFFNDWLFAWVEVVEHQLTEVHLREREQWLRGAAAMRAAEVRALLEGARPDVAETSKRLGYALDRVHVAFLVWSESEDDVFSALEQHAADVAAALGATATLTLPRGRALVCWASVFGQGPGPSPKSLLGEGPGPSPKRRGLMTAFGTPRHGVEGFCRSHEEALEARRVAELCGRAGSVAFDDVALDALATADLEAARRFVEHELGPLAADDDASRRLRATLRTFFEEGASFVRAARRLGVHENTVTYRVHRAEELLGRRVSERQLELRVALRLARLV